MESLQKSQKKNRKAHQKYLFNQKWWNLEESQEYLLSQEFEWRNNREWQYWSDKKWKMVFGIPLPHKNINYIDSETLKEMCNISELVSQYTMIRKTGEGKFVAKCPFHEDKLPSLSINDNRGLWHCFAGCGGGDIYSFIMMAEKVDFPTAIKIVSRII